MYFLCFLSYLCFSTASSRKAKEAASVNLQPLQSNLKVLQEQQTHLQVNMILLLYLAKSCARASERCAAIRVEAGSRRALHTVSVGIWRGEHGRSMMD